MCWPEADLDPVQGVTGLEKAQLSSRSVLPLLILNLLVTAVFLQSSGFP